MKKEGRRHWSSSLSGRYNFLLFWNGDNPSKYFVEDKASMDLTLAVEMFEEAEYTNLAIGMMVAGELF